MFFFRKDKKEMQEIKDELNKPFEGPIGPDNAPVVDRVVDFDEQGGWKDEYTIPPGIEPAIRPPFEPMPMPTRPMAPMPVEPIRRMPMPADIGQSIEEEMAAAPVRHAEGEAPLFIRVDKYQDLLAHVKEMKTFLAMFRKTLDVLREIETAKDDALKILRASAIRIERVLDTADQELLKPELGGEGVEDVGKEEAAHVEDTLEGLHAEIENLKRELKGME